MPEIRAACRGCHGGCVHILTVEDGRLTKLRPDPDSPLSLGRACPKGYTAIEQAYHPDRLLYPLRRKGERGSGEWERISWDEALDIIAARLKAIIAESGPESISMLTGTGRHHLAHYSRFANVLGTPNPSSAGALICLGPRMTAGMLTAGTFAGVDYYGSVKPAGILVWGANPLVSGADGELQWRLRDAMEAGTPLIVVDPVPTELARSARLWLRPRPGTDGALALAIIDVLISEKLYDRDFVENRTLGFEELRERCAEYPPERAAEICRVPAEDIRKAARLIASLKPLSLEWGCAVEQSVNALQTCRAIYMIPALTGNFDVPGGFVASKDIAPVADPLDGRLTQGAREKRLDSPPLSLPPFVHPYKMLEAVRERRIRALIINANNPLLSLPDARHTRECLREAEFIVCMELFMTPSASLADIVLPAALWPEIDGLFCMPEFAEEALLCMRRAVGVGECRSDEEFYLELSRRMGLDYGAETLEEIFDGQLAEMARRRPEYAGLDFERLKDLAWVSPKREYLNYVKNGGFKTPSGKFELYSLAMEKAGCDALPSWTEPSETPVSAPETAKKYPLILTTGGRVQQYFISNNRQIGSLRRAHPFPLVSMSPETAGEYGIADGDWAYIESPRGRITQKAALIPGMAPGVVSCEMGWWYPEAGAPDYGWAESNANVLTLGDAPYDPVFGSYQLRALLCRVYKNDGCDIERRYFDSVKTKLPPIDDSSCGVILDPSKCLLCGECTRACPTGALEIGFDGEATYARGRDGQTLAEAGCAGCGCCAEVCKAGAIRAL